jgi:hypothetical protein
MQSEPSKRSKRDKKQSQGLVDKIADPLSAVVVEDVVRTFSF